MELRKPARLSSGTRRVVSIVIPPSPSFRHVNLYIHRPKAFADAIFRVNSDFIGIFSILKIDIAFPIC